MADEDDGADADSGGQAPADADQTSSNGGQSVEGTWDERPPARQHGDEASIGEEDGQGNVAGTLPMSGAVEPQVVSLENAFFVAVGVYLAVLAAVFMVSPGGVSLVTVGLVTGVVGAVALLLVGAFGAFDPTT